jgi:Xaa-Pro aminopeptidase
MRYRPIDPKLFIENRRRLRAQLTKDQVVVLRANKPVVRSRDTEYTYRQDSNFFWASGIDQSESILVLSHDAETLYVRDATELEMVWIGPRLSLAEANQVSGVTDVRPLKSYKKPKVLFDATGLIAGLRMIKLPFEIELIRQAIDVTRQGLESAQKLIKPGIKEYEIEAELSRVYVKNGATHAFDPIVAGGLNANVMHYLRNDQVLRMGEGLLIDTGAEYANYAADITRVYPISGHFGERQQAVYDAVLRVQREAIAFAKPGVTWKQYETLMETRIGEELMGLKLLKKSDIAPKGQRQPAIRAFFPTASHFLGLDTHDAGDYHRPFEPGMVLTCEPGIYIREEGIGVRLEDDILITKDGSENLSASIPI